MSYEELSDSVKLSEGFRNKIYQDTEGFDTIGWGHKVVSADNFVADKEYTEEELQAVFRNIKEKSSFVEGGLTGRKIRRLNVDNWDDQDLVNKMSLYMNRHLRRVIQENNSCYF